MHKQFVLIVLCEYCVKHSNIDVDFGTYYKYRLI